MPISKWKFVTNYNVTKYKCGASAGDKVRLRKRLVITDSTGKLPAKTNRAGGIWTVLPGSRQDPGIVWLREPNGDRHTWDDEPEFWVWFAKVKNSQAKQRRHKTVKRIKKKAR